MNGYTIMWIALLAAFLLTEICTAAVVSIWFAIGSLAAIALSLLDVHISIQIIAFVVVSVASLLLLRSYTRKRLISGASATNIDALIGTEGIVKEDIRNLEATGRVRLGAMEWSARSSSGDPIPAGTVVKVDKIEGVKVLVTPVPEKIKEEIL